MYASKVFFFYIKSANNNFSYNFSDQRGPCVGISLK